jgi:glycosyltransferase involved in cell wall biosynthesis
MCTCNGEAYLQEQLQSIASQTIPPDELVVCDDASTDGTAAVLRSFAETCPFPVTILINQDRLGVCRNFEKGVSHCSGDIIFLADQDDVWMPGKIAAMLPIFESNPQCGYVFSNADLIDEHGNPLGRDLWTSIAFDKGQQIKYAEGKQLDVMLRRFTLSYGTTMAFRAAYKTMLMPFDCRFSLAMVHDGWISLVLSSIGAYGIAMPSSLSKYRQHPKQLASAGEPLRFMELLKKKRSSAMKADLILADFLEALAARLEVLEQAQECVLGARRQLLEKSTHLRARARANSSRGFQRFKTVFLESLSGRYGRYSRSYKSIVKDLISN